MAVFQDGNVQLVNPGDPMSTIWEEDGVTIDICYEYEYFEVFGLTEEEENELLAFYNSLIGK
jgi:hypothetical protein